MSKKLKKTPMQEMHDAILILQTDIGWLKKIIVGAAGLGFIEKLIGWIVK